MDNEMRFIFRNRDEWRSWLIQNHTKSEGIWVIYYKKHTGKESLSYNEGVEEALCFGWIDSLVKSIDQQMYMQKYTPRRKNSVWSETNRKRVQKMIETGKMTTAGLKMVEVARKNGQWEKAYGQALNSEMPKDLEKALQENPKAKENFYRFAPSHQRIYIHWLNSAKREETRLKRIDKIVTLAEQGKKPGII